MADQRLEEPARDSDLEHASSITINAKAVDLTEDECPNALALPAAEDKEANVPKLEQPVAIENATNQNEDCDSIVKDDQAECVDGSCAQNDEVADSNITEQDLASLRQDVQEIALAANKRQAAADTLDVVWFQCSSMREFQSICEQIHARLASAIKQLHVEGKAARPKAMHEYNQILRQFRSILVAFGGRDSFIRLVSYNTVLEGCRNVHGRLDRFLLQYGFESNTSIHDWKAQFCDKMLYHSFLADLRRNEEVIIQVLRDPATQMKTSDLVKSLPQSRVLRLPRDNFNGIRNMRPAYPKWFISSREVEVDSVPFARGRSSNIHRGTWDGASVVIKFIPGDSSETRDAFLNEVAVWHNLQHPNILRLLGACDDIKLFFVCEMASTKTLSKYAYGKSSAEIWAKLYEAALAIKYVHKRHGVIHGDIKCSNILIGEDNRAKLTGFGSSFVLKTDCHNNTSEVGNVDWHCAPEIIHGMNCKSFASDVYSLGMCIIEAMVNQTQCGYVPDSKMKRDILRTKDIVGRPDNMNDKQWSLVSQMCSWLPSCRPDMTTIASLLKCIANEESKAESDAYLQKSHETVARKQPRVKPEWFIGENQVEIVTNSFKRGSFGLIHHGKYGGAEVVVKRLLEESTHSKKGMKSFMNEAKVWHKLNHPHVIRLYGACDISNPPFYVCESAVKHGNLDDYLCLHDKEMKTVWRLFHQAAMGLLYLHQQQIVHGDLKCNNILVSDNKTAKLADFGLSIIRMESKTISKQVQTGAIQWVAPECLSGAVENPTPASDIYSFAMCIIEAFKRNTPWGGSPDVAVIRRVAEGYLPQRPIKISDDGWTLVKKMSATDPTVRISVQQVVDHLEILADKEEEEERNEQPMCQSMNCLTLNEKGSKFCRQCGLKLNPEES